VRVETHRGATELRNALSPLRCRADNPVDGRIGRSTGGECANPAPGGRRRVARGARSSHSGAFQGTEFEVAHTSRVEEALALLGENRFDLALLDLSSLEASGLDALGHAQVAAWEIPIIALADHDDEAEAVRTLRLGAQDYVVKSQSTPRSLTRSIRHAVERHRLLRELQIARRREHFMATHDSLTGLTNRFSFNEQLDRALAHATRNSSRLAVFFLDLDRFKYINDTLGHSVGDELLNQVAERLASETRKSDLIARVGGDEFLALVQDLEYDQTAARVAEKLLESLSMPYTLQSREYWVSASLGISTFPRDGKDRETLVRHADAALYQAKAKGRNNYQFYSKVLNAASRKRFTMERNLRRALERRELEIYYQPTVEMATSRITGAEALLRWADADLGPVSPTEFIPIAEETGLIRPLGDWVLYSACSQAKAWQDEYALDSFSMSVNVSTHQIQREKLRESIVRVLWDSGLPARCLALEITESTLMENAKVGIEALQELKRIGVGVSLDDFGTGFSSLSYLKLIPVDTVKIDQSFVNDIVFDPDDAAIVSAVLSIAEQLRLRAVAEGVETVEQRDWLRARGCQEMQGHIFSPAVPAEEFAELLRANCALERDR
jgi:diguanylate cyclase (GGDEF)-like protein